MHENQRFQDSGKHLIDFGGEYLVHCPKCDAPARIAGGKLRCGNCGLALDKPVGGIRRSQNGRYFEGISTRDWFADVEPRVKRGNSTIRPICRKCGASFEDLKLQPRQNSSSLPQTTSATCLRCNTNNEFSIGWHPFLPADQPRDPLFGCQLLLQKDLKAGMLYAYNSGHAQEYLAFIEAKQRERQPISTGTSSFFTKLPAWIKSAKNRDAIAKALKQMIADAKKIT